MTKLASAFQKKPTFMPYYPLGYPTIEGSLNAIQGLADGGADLIEIGLPFSDPLADGPIIQHATQAAIKNGVTTERGLQLVSELRRRGVAVPLVLMAYVNPLLSFGFEKLADRMRKTGMDGIIIPDLPVEESANARKAFAPDLPLIAMLAPTTTAERAKKICAESEGFLYIVSVKGVTGMRTSISAELPGLLARIRTQAKTGLPLCVGFGISTPALAAEVGRLADGVIVGSACVKDVGGSSDPYDAGVKFSEAFINAMRM